MSAPADPRFRSWSFVWGAGSIDRSMIPASTTQVPAQGPPHLPKRRFPCPVPARNAGVAYWWRAVRAFTILSSRSDRVAPTSAFRPNWSLLILQSLSHHPDGRCTLLRSASNPSAALRGDRNHLQALSCCRSGGRLADRIVRRSRRAGLVQYERGGTPAFVRSLRAGHLRERSGRLRSAAEARANGAEGCERPMSGRHLQL